jgi:hypothetical protein
MVVLTNSYYGGDELREVVTLSIADSYMGLNDNDWDSKYLERHLAQSGEAHEIVEKVWETVEAANDEHINREDYTGVFTDPWFGKIKIYQQEDQLWFTSLRSPALTGPMHYYKANAFAIKWEKREMDADAFAIFSLDELGKAKGMKMKGISPDIDFSYDFQDLDFERVD